MQEMTAHTKHTRSLREIIQETPCSHNCISLLVVLRTAINCNGVQEHAAATNTAGNEEKRYRSKRPVFLVIIYSSSFPYIVKFTVNKAHKAPVHIDASHAQDARTLTNVL